MSPVPDAPNTEASENSLLSSLRVVGADAIRYLELKLRLASLEGAEAGARYAKALALSALGAVLIGAADLFLCAALVSLLTDLVRSAWEGMRWEYAALLVGLGHLVVGAALLKSAKSNASQGVFPETIDQLNKDREWLNKTTKPHS